MQHRLSFLNLEVPSSIPRLFKVQVQESKAQKEKGVSSSPKSSLGHPFVGSRASLIIDMNTQGHVLPVTPEGYGLNLWPLRTWQKNVHCAKK